MPLIALTLLNLALALGLAFVCATELRSTARGPWNTRAARALALHQLLLVFPLGAWWMLRAPDWAVSYFFHAARAPSLLLGGLVLIATLMGLVGFWLGALLVSRHRTDALPFASAAVAVAVLIGGLALRARIASVTSYVHFKGGLGSQTGLTAHGPEIFLLGVALWIGGGICLLLASRLPLVAHPWTTEKNSR
jgi:hypothetical protein